MKQWSWKRIGFIAFGIPALIMALAVALYGSACEKWFPFNGWKYIVIHHSATTSGSTTAFHRYHLQRGIPGGLAYHFVIGNGMGADDGSVVAGHRWEKSQAGGHVTINAWHYNVFGIGICLVGNLDQKQPSDRQWRALVNTLIQLCDKHHISPENILGHTAVPWFWNRNQTERTACPGRFVDIGKLRQKVRQGLSQP